MSVMELHENGTMMFLVEHGLVTPSAFRKLELFVEVKNLEHQGVKKSHAVELVSDKCNVCEDTVWRALRSFNY